MIDYVFVFFLPGAAGNFFSRCLSLAGNQTYGWVPDKTNNVGLSADQKHQAYSYSESALHQDWKKFEGKLVHYSTVTDHHSIPTGSVSLWSEHPRYQLLDCNLTGTDNQQHVFYIDPSDKFEWVILNSLYKNSTIDVKWLQEGQAMLTDSDIYKISLANIIESSATAWLEVEKVYAIIKHKCSNKELVEDLWQQWNSTTLKPGEFNSFKRSIGFKL
jgi:hypothetical protein